MLPDRRRSLACGAGGLRTRGTCSEHCTTEARADYKIVNERTSSPRYSASPKRTSGLPAYRLTLWKSSGTGVQPQGSFKCV